MKRWSRILLVALCVVLLGGCGAKKLSKAYNEDKLKAASEEIIKDFYNEKYDDITAKFSADLKSALSSSQLKEVWTNYKVLGKYDSMSKIVFQEDKGYAIAVAIAKFEKGKVQFTISFNKDMKLVGLYIK